jgi:hypothetical protein
MKRRSFLTLVSAAGTFGATGLPRALLARERVAGIGIRARGDRQWLNGRPGACASVRGPRMTLGGYTLDQLLT